MEKSEDVGCGDDGRAWQSYQTAYTTAKAGMEGVDKEKVQRVVYEMSKGSKYFENEERKEREIKQKIDNMRTRCMNLSAKDLIYYEKVAEKRILYLDATRDLSRIWLHVDMDAFFAAVETLSNPSLNGKPMAVGSMSMISTANYEARKFGVRSAMPGFIAIRLCPELIFVPTDFKKYTYYSDLTRKVFQRYDANFIAASLDEAYLDISSVCKEKGFSSEEIAHELRSSVYEETGLTCSAGVASNRLLAKVCSDINKPNGQFVLPNHRAAVMAFVSSLPIRKIGGIGKVTEYILRDALGISTCEDMIKKGGQLCALFSNSAAGGLKGNQMPCLSNNLDDCRNSGFFFCVYVKLHTSGSDFFLSVGLGLGGTDAPEVRLRKSISNERTFRATNNENLLYQRLAELSETLSSDMQKESLCGRTLTLKLKTESFEVRTRAVTLQKYISSSDDILQHASKLLKAELPLSLRLIGLRMSHFKEDEVNGLSDPTQKTLKEFIVSEDHSTRKKGGQFPLDLSDHLINENEKGLFGSRLEICQDDFEDKNVNNSSKMNYGDCCFELEKCECSSSGLSTDKVDKSYEMGCTETPCETESSDRMTTKSYSMDEALSRKTEQILWVDDYMCSLCGVELPPSFVQERQEHSDFHIAEKLQQEESGSRSILRQRIENNDQVGGKRKQKRQKPSAKQGRHIPIDMFFAKSKSILE